MWSYRIYNGGGGGPVVIPPEAGNLTGIVVTKLPYKIHYNYGEWLEPEGLQITALFDNDVTADVTNGCTVEVECPLAKEETKVLVMYEGFSTSFTVNVYAQPLEVPPGTAYLHHFDGDTSNSIESNPNSSNTRDIAYVTGKFRGKAVKGTSTSASFTIYNGDTISLPTKSELSNGASATYEGWFKNTSTTLTSGASRAGRLITIADSVILSIYSNNTYKAEWISGDNVGIGDCYNDWVHVAIVFKDSYSKVFVNGKKIIEGPVSGTGSGYNVKIIDSTTSLYVDEITISTEALYDYDFIPPIAPYGGKRTLQTLTVETLPTKTDYEVGETFSLDGAVIKAVYSDGSQSDVTSECVIANNNPLTLQDDFRAIAYTYEGVTKCVYINVGAYDIDPLEPEELSVTPSMNEQIKTGLFNEVTINGDENLIPDNIVKGVNIFGVEGTAIVGGGPIVIPPEAGNLTGIIVTKLPYKVHYNHGEWLEVDGLQITALFDNDITADVTNGCTIEVESPLVKEETKVLITYEGFSTSFTVNVYSQPLEIPSGTLCLCHLDGNTNNEMPATLDVSNYNTEFALYGKFHSKCIKTKGANGYFYFRNDGLPTRANLVSGSKNVTVECWIKCNEIINTNTEFMKIASNISIGISNNNTYAVSNITNAFTAVGDSYNDWVHLAVVVKDSVLKLFINGQKLGEGVVESMSTSTNEYRFVSNIKNLYLDEILVSTDALYEDNFIPPAGPYGGKRTLQKILVETNPIKTDYLVGETFNLDGAVIKAVYSDGVQLDVTTECIIIGDGIITDSTDFMQIQYTYNGVSKNVFVNIGRLSE